MSAPADEGRAWVAPPPDVRVPDFVVIGAMRAGTTSLWRWLGEHPGTALPGAKEPNLFLSEIRMRSVPWEGFLPPVSAGVTGEASVSYADPAHAATVAERISRVAPGARLVYVVRDPVARLRSHYRHSYLRGAERRPITDAAVPGSGYVERSRYATVLEGFRQHLPAEQLLVVQLERLVDDDGETWGELLRHLGLAPRPRPDVVANATDDKALVSPLARRYFDLGLDRRLRSVLPQGLRHRVAGRLIRDRGGAEEARRAGGGALRSEVLELLEQEMRDLERLWGRSTGWRPPAAP